MTFLEQAAIAAMQSLIIANPRETPERLSSWAMNYARSLDARVSKPKEAESKMIWFAGMRVEVNTMPIDCTDMDKRTKAVLTRNGIKTVGDMLKLSYLQLANIPDMGRMTRSSVYNFLDDHCLGMSGERL